MKYSNKIAILFVFFGFLFVFFLCQDYEFFVIVAKVISNEAFLWGFACAEGAQSHFHRHQNTKCCVLRVLLHPAVAAAREGLLLPKISHKSV